MDIPEHVFVELEQHLPQITPDSPPFLLVDFEHNGNSYSIYFYKVRDYGAEFWLCNPLQVHDRIGG